MRESLYSKCELFIKNRDAFKAAFSFENAYFHPVCASVFLDRDRVADVEHLKDTRKLLKSRVNVFSNFRSNCELPLIAMLAVCDEPERRLDEAIELYNCLKKHFFTSEFLPITAMILSEHVSREKYGEISESTRRIYNLMKKEHPFLTSSEDCIFAAMLALSERGEEELIRDVETCYSILKEKFHDRNALQSLSHVVALTGNETMSVKDRCRDTARLFDLLKEKKHKYGTGYELATLASLAALPCGVDETARDIIEASEFLKTQKGYGFWGFAKTQRLLHAGMIVTAEHIGGSEMMSGAAVGGTLSMIAAQQAATCAAISASVAANAASSASH